MALFQNRPLALACILVIVVTFLSFFLPVGFLIAGFVITGIAAIALLAYTLYKRPNHIWLTIFVVICALLLALLRVCTDRIFIQKRWDSYMDTTVCAELHVREIRYISEYESELLVDVREVDGERFRSTAVLRSNGPLSLYVGDRFTGTFAVKPLSFEEYQSGMAYTYMGEGAKVLLLIEDTTAYTLQKSGVNTLAFRLSTLRTTLSYRIASACGGEAGNLLGSLLLGTRSKLSDTTVRDFSRVGVSHLLALSGLHLGVLAGIFDGLLLLFRCKRTLRTIVVMVVCVAYLALTGFSFSMLRAVVMLLFVYFSFWHKTDYDPMTALCFCAGVFTILSPTALFNVSFRLTFLATFGILVASDIMRSLHFKIPARKGAKRNVRMILYFITFSLLSTLLTTLAVLPVTWLSFGEISVMTPLANLLLLPMAPLLLFGAILVLLLPVAPIALLVSLPARLLLYITTTLSQTRCVLSLSHNFVPYVLIPLFLVTTILLLLDLKKRRYLILAPMTVAILAFGVCLFALQISSKDTLGVTYVRNEKNESIVITQGTNTVICDQSSGSLSSLYEAINAANELGVTEIDTLILSHYHDAHETSVRRFCQKIKVRSVLLPAPQNETELARMQCIRNALSELGVTAQIYQYGSAISLFDIGNITIHRALNTNEASHPSFAITIRKNNETICYHSATTALLAQETPLAHKCGTQALLIGAHAPSLREPVSLYYTNATVYLCNEKLCQNVHPHTANTCVIGTNKAYFVLE